MPGAFSFNKTTNLNDDTYHDNLVANAQGDKEPMHSPSLQTEKRGMESPLIGDRHNDASFRSNVMNTLNNVPNDTDDRKNFMPLVPDETNGSEVLPSPSVAQNNAGSTHTANKKEGLLDSTLSKIGLNNASNTQESKSTTDISNDVSKTISSGVQNAKSTVTGAVNSIVAPVQEQLKSNDSKPNSEAPSTLNYLSNKITQTFPSLVPSDKDTAANQLDEVAQHVQEEKENKNKAADQLNELGRRAKEDDNIISTPALSNMEKQLDRDIQDNQIPTTDNTTENSKNIKALVDQDTSLPRSMDGGDFMLETANNETYPNTQPNLRSMAGDIAPIPKLPQKPSFEKADSFSIISDQSGLASPPPSLSSGLASNTSTPVTSTFNKPRDIANSHEDLTPTSESPIDPIAKQSSGLPSHEPRNNSISSGSHIPAVLSGATAGSAVPSGSEVKAACKSNRFELPPFNKEHSGWTPDVEVPEFTSNDDVDVPSGQQRGSDASSSSVLGTLSLGLDKLRSGVNGLLSSPTDKHNNETKDTPHHMKDVDVPGSVDDESITPSVPRQSSANDMEPVPMAVTTPKTDDVDIAEEHKDSNDDSEFGYAKILVPSINPVEQLASTVNTNSMPGEALSEDTTRVPPIEQITASKSNADRDILPEKPLPKDTNRVPPIEQVTASKSNADKDVLSEKPLPQTPLSNDTSRVPSVEQMVASKSNVDKDVLPEKPLPKDTNRVPPIEQMTASKSNTDKLASDIEKQLDNMHSSKDKQLSNASMQHMQGPVSDDQHHTVPAHVKSVIYHDHAAEDALLHSNEKDSVLPVRKGFENFSGLGVKCVPSSNNDTQS
ncbi:uncharacterized protein B0P05DRAFT_363645 [Gilbertella persicaria]|uniref:uncharacterized protein n=1 Tax=Gilbertella persicaria TaxID=101096 RepID=UPI00222079D2|nr:uncharacterized protein B0P05DRAFT_363645 [Gilbertella persicaria]KAI8047398.1 hypothetical protein B0P05DRAFT_363645 [Gilbertella persicaria]